MIFIHWILTVLSIVFPQSWFVLQNDFSTFLDTRMKSDVIATAAGMQWLNLVTVWSLAL